MFLAVDVVALLALGTFAALVPPGVGGLLATGVGGLGALLCLLPLLLGLPATLLNIPVGPPGLSLQLTLDSLSAYFLFLAFLSGTAIAGFMAIAGPLASTASVRLTAFCLAGTTLALLAADGVTLTIGMAMTCGAVSVPGQRRRTPLLLIPLLLLAAVCLLTPAGFTPRFDTIRAAPINPERGAAAAALALAAATGLAWGGSVWSSSGAWGGSGERCWSRTALTAGAGIPLATYLLVRIIADLSAAAAQGWWGVVLLLTGGAVAVAQSWRSAAHPDLDGAVACLVRRQTGLAVTGVGLTLICRTEDLPAATSFALAATFLLALSGGLAGTAASLAASAIGSNAGTYRLSRLGGLVHVMPGMSAALAAGLFGMSALPPGPGFACLWLLFEAILSAPRTGGVFSQLPIALTAGSVALSAALATTASVRLGGIALLGRPRSPRGSGASESHRGTSMIVTALAGLTLLVGVLPGPCLWLLADPAIRTVVGIPPNPLAGFAVMSAGSSAYLPLPVLALVALATGIVTLARRWRSKEAKVVGPWTDGMAPPAGLPFGEPAAQSAGEGFLPPLPDNPLPPGLRVPRGFQMTAWPTLRPLSPAGATCVVLGAFAALLLILAVAQ
jgi:hydrogenase-4 component B